MKVPLQVSCTHQSKVKLGEPMLCRFSVKNISEEVLQIYVSMGSDIGQAEQPAFLIAGESVSKVDLMPFADPYTFTFTFVPLRLGMLELPNFAISKKPPVKGLMHQTDENQLFLLSGYTSKVFVSSK